MIAYQATPGFIFSFDTDDDVLSDTLERCFVDIRINGEASVVFTCRRLSSERTLVRVVGEPEIAYPNDLLLEELVTTINRRALDSEPSRLHFHAAGLSINDRGVLLAAEAGTGKSTISAELVSRGWTYLSDESIAIEEPGDELYGFPKPITLRAGGARMLGDASSASVTLPGTNPERTHLPAAALNGQVTRTARPTTALVLKRQTNARDRPVVCRLSPAEAVVSLLGHTQDFERFGKDGLWALSSLAAKCACYELHLGTLEQSVAAIESLMTEQSQPTETSTPVRVPSFGDIETIRLLDESVLLNRATGRSAHLPEDSSSYWLRHINGTTSVEGDRLIDQLRQAQVLTGDDR